MNRWIYLLACLVIGLATVFASNLLARTDAHENASSPIHIDKKPEQVRIKNMQKMMVMQQRQQMQTALFKMYSERQNINAALETLEKRRLKSKEFSSPSFSKNAGEQEKHLKERLRVLVTDISSFEKQLSTKN
ncbi:hypothetical protein [Bdellovibrio sp. HCB337]|uniref:hypothetical protein n=1 Tax=Bdellovibrio sp. HCB337 TaxID=3394358 RepID=UPI0039A770CC